MFVDWFAVRDCVTYHSQLARLTFSSGYYGSLDWARFLFEAMQQTEGLEAFAKAGEIS